MTENVVRATRFELVDDYGNVYATMGKSEDTGATALTFYDDDQVPRVVIGINESRTGSVDLRDATGRGGIRVAVEESGSAVIRLRDMQDRERYNLVYSPPGASELVPEGALNLTFLDENVVPRVQLGITTSSSAPILLLSDRNGTEAVTLTVGDQIGSLLALSDDQGRPRAGIMVSEDNSPVLVFFDEHGNVIGGEAGEDPQE